MAADRVIWTPQPGSQTLFLCCPVFELLYHGTRGPGKTDALVMDFAQHVGQGFGASWRGILFRQSYPQLEDVRAKTKRWYRQIFPGARWHGSQYKWLFPDGEELLLRHMARPHDYWDYHGHEYPWIGWEELSNWSTPDCYEAMMACCRSSDPDVPRKIRATCNPYGPGHSWIKTRFIESVPPGEILHDESGRGRAHLFGSLFENRVLLEADPDYIKTLRADSNENRRKAWLEGRWDIVAGGMFDDLWQPGAHVVPPFQIPATWRVDRSFDWGSAKPFSVGWWAESDGTDIVQADGTRQPTVRGDMFRIAEWYGWNGKPNEGSRLLIIDIARGIRSREKALGLKVEPGPADSQIFTAVEGRSQAATMAAEGVHWVAADKSPGSRKAGVERLRALLAGALTKADGLREQPGLFVFATCRHFIRTVPVLPRDPRDPDDVDSATEDHVYDETRYRILARKGLGGTHQIRGYH